MKVFNAVVSSVTDYRKEHTVEIDHCSVHPTEPQAVKAIMTALVQTFPHLIPHFPMDMKSVLGEEVSEGRMCRLKEYLRGSEPEWQEDDVPHEKEAFKKFEETETAAITELATKWTTYIENNKDIPFTELEVPDLPNGSYVCNPVVWKIVELDIAWNEDEGKRKKRAIDGERN